MIRALLRELTSGGVEDELSGGGSSPGAGQAALEPDSGLGDGENRVDSAAI